MYAQAHIRVVVQADDLGYSCTRDDGIVSCFTAGGITAASLLVNGASVQYAVDEARRVGLPLGLHLNLSDGRPLCTPQQVPSLVDDDGVLFPKHEFRQRCKDRLIDVDHVRVEMIAQVNRFRELTDELPFRVDGHQHVHVIPHIVAVVAQTMAHFGIKETRIPSEQVLGSWIEPPKRRAFYLNVTAEADAAKGVFREAGVCFSDFFVGMSVMGHDGNTNRICAMFDALPRERATSGDGPQRSTTCEFMVHPGNQVRPNEVAGCGKGPDGFSQSIERVHEMEFLKGDAFRELVKERSLDLVPRLLDTSSGAGYLAPVDDAHVVVRSPNHHPPPTPTGIDPTPTPNGTHHTAGRKHFAVLSPLIPGTGNSTTAHRLQRQFCEIEGMRVSLLDVNHITETELQRFVDANDITHMVGLHAFRSGRLFLNLDVPYTIILGGTDVNVMLHEEERGAIVRKALAGAERVVGFNTDMKNNVDGLSLKQPAFSIPQAIPVDWAVTQTNDRAVFEAFCENCGIVGDLSKVVAFPCGIRTVKDPLFSFPAIKQLHGEDARVKLLILGPILEEQVAEKLFKVARHAHDKTFQSCVVYHPPVPYLTMLHIIRHSAMLINTSFSEGMSNAILESLSLGTPVLVRSNEGNNVLVEDSVTGRVFKDEQEFLAMARDLLDHGDAVKDMSRRGVEMIRSKYSTAKELEKYRLVFQGL